MKTQSQLFIFTATLVLSRNSKAQKEALIPFKDTKLISDISTSNLVEKMKSKKYREFMESYLYLNLLQNGK